MACLFCTDEDTHDHHIIPQRTPGVYDERTVELCQSCHAKAHSNIVDPLTVAYGGVPDAAYDTYDDDLRTVFELITIGERASYRETVALAEDHDIPPPVAHKFASTLKTIGLIGPF